VFSRRPRAGSRAGGWGVIFRRPPDLVRAFERERYEVHLFLSELRRVTIRAWPTHSAMLYFPKKGV
jgi:hypothetical protein